MYDQKYVEFDEYGIVTVHCMRCHTPVIIRTYIEMPNLRDKSKTEKVMTLKRLGIHTETIVELDDGSTTGLPHCIGCSTNGELEMDKIQSLRVSAMKDEMIHAGKPAKYVDDLIERQKKIKVLKKKENLNAR